MSKPLFALRRACDWAAVSGAPKGATASPIDLSVCSSADWDVRRSAATASRICLAWSRSSEDVMDADAGEQVAANASHLIRIRSMSLKMKSASRKFNVPEGGPDRLYQFVVERLLLARRLTIGTDRTPSAGEFTLSTPSGRTPMTAIGWSALPCYFGRS